MYQVIVRLAEPRNSAMSPVLNFATKEERQEYVSGPESVVYWYHFVEDDDWHLWRRGGAWKRTAKPLKADAEVVPPEITPKDRRW